MNTKKILGVVAVLALVAVAMVGAGAAAQTLTASTYDQFTTAITNAGTGDTIQLTGSFAVTTETFIPSGKDIILDLNGNTLSTSGSPNQGGVLAVARGAKLTIMDSGTNGTIDATTTNSEYYAAVKVTYSKDGGEGTAELIVNSGILKGYIAGICGNGNRDGYSITVNGGTVQGCYASGTVEPYSGWGETGSTGIYAPSNGTVIIKDGTVEGYYSAIEIRGGSLVVDGGTLRSNYTGTFDCVANGSGLTTKGAAVAVAQHTTKKAVELTVNSGSLIADGTGHKINVGNPHNNSTENVTLTKVGSNDVYLNHDAKITCSNWDTVKTQIKEAKEGTTVAAPVGTVTFNQDYTSGGTQTIDSVTTVTPSKNTDVKMKADLTYTFTIPATADLVVAVNGQITYDIAINAAIKDTARGLKLKLDSKADTGTGTFAVKNGANNATYSISAKADSESSWKAIEDNTTSNNVLLDFAMNDPSSSSINGDIKFNTLTIPSVAGTYTGTLKFVVTPYYLSS